MTGWNQRLLFGAALVLSFAAAAQPAQPAAATAVPAAGATSAATTTAPLPAPAPAAETATAIAPALTAPAVAAPPPGSVAAPEPKPDDTQAVRTKTQPGNNAPFWRAVRDSGTNEGVVNLPGAEKGVLIQRFVRYPGSRFTSAGEAWREVRNRWLVPYGGALLIIVALALAIFYWRKGPIGGHVADTGRKIERFTPFERAAHWSNAVAFVVLAVSGIVMAFGKHFLLPLVGGTLFGWLTYALKTMHNFAGPLFAVSLVVVFVTFVRDNFPGRGDWRWLRAGGGLLGGAEPPSGRFNAGEKIVFWAGVLGLGVVVVASGLVLDGLMPGLEGSRGEMQIAHMVHAVGTALMMAMFMAHIYLGTIGMRGAYRGMRTGYVDEGWALEHHALWYEDVKAGRVPVQRSHELPPDGALLAPAAPVVR